MQTNEIHYVGFWKRVLAAVTDSYFFTMVSFLILLGLYRAEYVKYLESMFAAVFALIRSPLNFNALSQLTSPFNAAEGIIYFWLPVLATLTLWITRSASPGLMAIPAQVIDVRTGQKPSILRFVIRMVAFVLFGYLMGLDYLWIVFNKKKQALHDLVSGTAVVYSASPVKSGEWGKPDRRTIFIYILVAAIALILNYGLESLLFDVNAEAIPLLPGINVESGLHSVANSPVFEVWAICLLIGCFVIPVMFFRFSLRWLDGWWLIAGALLCGGGLSNILERTITGGVRNIFVVEHGFRYICLVCGIQFDSYYFNLADFWISVGIVSMGLILLVSRSWLIVKSFQKPKSQEIMMASQGSA